MRLLPVLASFTALNCAAAPDNEPPHRLGDHPAVVVQRLLRNAGYDYASHFYPHPAWLYLRRDARADDPGERGIRPPTDPGQCRHSPRAPECLPW